MKEVVMHFNVIAMNTNLVEALTLVGSGVGLLVGSWNVDTS